MIFGHDVLSSMPTSVAGSIPGKKAVGAWVDEDAMGELRPAPPGLEGGKSPMTDAEYDARSFLRRLWIFSTISASTVGVDAVMLMIIGFVGGLPSSIGVVRMV